MKLLKLIFSLYIILAISFNTYANSNKIIGKWEVDSKDAIFEFYEKDGKFYSKLVYGAQVIEEDGITSKKDTSNPDKALRNRDLIGITNITGLVFEDGKYLYGKIYDGRSGDLYDCKIKIVDNVMHLRGYMRFSWLGQTTKWHRYSQLSDSGDK